MLVLIMSALLKHVTTVVHCAPDAILYNNNNNNNNMISTVLHYTFVFPFKVVYWLLLAIMLFSNVHILHLSLLCKPVFYSPYCMMQ